MNKSPAFQFYPSDFLSDPNTLVMNPEEIGVYWLLICVCWKENGLPKELKKLSRLARVQDKKFSRMWNDTISECFYFCEESQTFRNKRLDEEQQKQGLNSEKRKIAAEKRWTKTDANALQTECKTDAMQCLSSSSSTSSSTSINTSKKNNAGARFDSKNLADNKLNQELEDLIFWIKQKKQMKSLHDEQEWIDLIAKLEFEDISLPEFKEFYVWVEKLAWTNTISPKLMRGQVEAWKNRETLKAKQIINAPNGFGKKPTLSKEEFDRQNEEFIAKKYANTNGNYTN